MTSARGEGSRQGDINLLLCMLCLWGSCGLCFISGSLRACSYSFKKLLIQKGLSFSNFELIFNYNDVLDVWSQHPLVIPIPGLACKCQITSELRNPFRPPLEGCWTRNFIVWPGNESDQAEGSSALYLTGSLEFHEKAPPSSSVGHGRSPPPPFHPPHQVSVDPFGCSSVPCLR